MASPKQTLSYLKRKFEEAGLRPINRYGQNFLIDLNLLRVLADAAQLGPDDVVLEVGTGTGSLTDLLSQRAGWVVTVEVDPQLHQLAREALFEHSNVTMLQQDALKNKNTVHPNVLDAVRSKLQEAPDTRHFKLAANLPYSIATPLISNLLLTDIVPDTMTVTIQKELADRIMARPGTKDYGALSVWVQSLCDVELVRILPPSVFWPRPKVDSAILHITHRPERRARIPDLEFLHEFTRTIFLHRRKLLRGSLSSSYGQVLEKATIDEVIQELGLPSDVRAEQLDTRQMQQLSEAIQTRLKSATGK